MPEDWKEQPDRPRHTRLFQTCRGRSRSNAPRHAAMFPRYLIGRQALRLIMSRNVNIVSETIPRYALAGNARVDARTKFDPARMRPVSRMNRAELMSANQSAALAIPKAKPPRGRPRPVGDPCRLPGLDLRTAHGMRFKQIAAGIVAEYPGSDVSRVRELALLKLAIELRQAKLLTDDPAQADELVRLSNLAARRERDLRSRRRAKREPSALERIVARHAEAAGK